MSKETIQLLIKHVSDVTIADSNGVTPLEHAEEKGFEEIASILRKAGAN